MFTAIVVFSVQIFVFYLNDWSIIKTYTNYYHPMALVIFIWCYLFWGIYNFVKFINFKNKDHDEKLQ